MAKKYGVSINCMAQLPSGVPFGTLVHHTVYANFNLLPAPPSEGGGTLWQMRHSIRSLMSNKITALAPLRDSPAAVLQCPPAHVRKDKALGVMFIVRLMCQRALEISAA